MSTAYVQRELPFDVRDMMANKMDISKETVQKVKDDCVIISPETFNWSCVERDSWFVCLSDAGDGYYFPMGESKNSENDYQRAKEGMKFFISQGWTAYKIQ